MELSSSSYVLIAIALIIIIGYVGIAIFKRTKIPEVLILMLIGVLIASTGNLLSVNTISTLRSFAPLFGSLALVVIMYNGSKRLKLDNKLMNLKGIAIGVLDTVLATVAVSALMHFMLGWPLIYGAILGAILGETSNIVVIPIIQRVDISEDIHNTLFMETTINSVLAIVMFSVLLIYLNTQAISVFASVNYILDYVGVAVFIGIVAGLIWMYVISAIGVARDYLATIAIALLLYGIVDVFNGAAIISVLIFGIMIGNYGIFANIFKLNTKVRRKGELHVEKSLEFIITTFFFVFMGMIMVLSLQYFVYGLVVVAVLILIRYFTSMTALHNNTPQDRGLFFALMPRGVTVATLASILYGMGGIYFTQTFYISFIIIAITSIVSSMLLYTIKLDIKK
ncbi:MAG: cation:proton antiporter [Candidatus Micrarchaeaceae archaeon]